MMGRLLEIVPYYVLRRSKHNLYGWGCNPLIGHLFGSAGPIDLKSVVVCSGTCVVTQRPRWTCRVCGQPDGARRMSTVWFQRNHHDIATNVWLMPHNVTLMRRQVPWHGKTILQLWQKKPSNELESYGLPTLVTNQTAAYFFFGRRSLG